VLFPRPPSPSDLMGVCINTAGGITGGDRFAIEAQAGAGSRLTLTTQAAERIYRARGDEVGRLSTRLSVARGARLDWLPQETILFDRSALRRSLCIDMADDATFLAVEPLVFGRITMGERLRRIAFTDNIRLIRAGELIFADAIRLTGDADAQLASRFAANGAGASAGVLYAAPDADLYLPRIRELLPETGGASLIRPGVLFARLVAPDSFLLRQSLIPVVEALRGAPLPKTWTL
jgi:urease accessory protein